MFPITALWTCSRVDFSRRWRMKLAARSRHLSEEVTSVVRSWETVVRKLSFEDLSGSDCWDVQQIEKIDQCPSLCLSLTTITMRHLVHSVHPTLCTVVLCHNEWLLNFSLFNFLCAVHRAQQNVWLVWLWLVRHQCGILLVSELRAVQFRLFSNLVPFLACAQSGGMNGLFWRTVPMQVRPSFRRSLASWRSVK